MCDERSFLSLLDLLIGDAGASLFLTIRQEIVSVLLAVNDGVRQRVRLLSIGGTDLGPSLGSAFRTQSGYDIHVTMLYSLLGKGRRGLLACVAVFDQRRLLVGLVFEVIGVHNIILLLFVFILARPLLHEHLSTLAS